MKPLWKIKSGAFAGWNSNDILYDVEGRNVGYFNGDLVYSNDGHYIGEMYDNSYIGKRSGVVHGIGGSRVGYVGIAFAPYAGRVGLAIAGWEDPDF